MEAGTVPEKVTISYRGPKYEVGRGKRFYGIWVVGAPESDPIDRWPLTSEGWTQAWARFVAIETPGTVTKVEKPRTGFKLSLPKRPGADPGAADGADPGAAGGASPGAAGGANPVAALRGRPSRAVTSAGLLGLGLLLGLVGLFPGYIGSSSLASQSELLVPHLLYLLAWAVSCALIALGAAKRVETLRLGALLGAGLSAVTFGLFWSDLGQVIAGGSSLLGAGLVLSLLGWLACTAGSLLALTVPLTVPPHAMTPHAVPPQAATPGTPGTPGTPVSGVPFTAPSLTSTPDTPPAPVQDAPAGLSQAAGQPLAEQPFAGQPLAGQPLAGQPLAGQRLAGPYLPGPSFAASPRVSRGRAAVSGPVRPRLADAGPLALIVLAAIGAVAAFVPSWDSYAVTSSVQGTSEVVTAGNAFSYPGVMIAGSVAAIIAVVAVAALAGLWRPVRHGAMLLTGATVALIAQAISALIQVTGPAPFAMFGLTQAQAAANGVTISSGLTPIFWVYCVFVISLVVSIAWMLTAPHYPVMPSAPVSPAPAPTDPQQDVDSETADSDDDAEDDAESSYA
jgi:hypothetical protein